MPYEKGGGRQCVIYGCHNNQKKLYDWKKSICDEHKQLYEDCPCLVPFSMHCIPANEEARMRWLKAINRKDYVPGRKDQVCSIHFIEGRPTTMHPDPQLTLGYDNMVKYGRRELKRTPLKEKKQIHVNNTDNHNNTDMDLNSKISGDGEELVRTASVQTKPVVVHSVYEQCTLYKPKYDAATQTVNFLDDHKYSKQKLFRNAAIQTDLQTFNISTEKDSVFFTGLSLNVLNVLIESMKVHSTNLKYSLSVKDQIILTLIRLRLASPFQDLGRRFNISSQLANSIYHTWINILSKHLKDLIVWLPRETIKRSMPSSFRKTYPHTTCVVDCTEVYIQRPLSVKARTATYSNYKSHNTAKILVAIAPNGYIMFISKCYGGRASDRFITKTSGFYNYLIPNDEVMADRGFTIGDDLFAMRVNLNMPSFLCGRKQLTEKEVTVSRRISSVRIHVERAIRRMKTYRILNSTVPVRSLKKMDKVVKVVAALSNLRGPLIKDKDENV